MVVEENSPGSEAVEQTEVETTSQENLGDNSQGTEDGLHPGWNELLEALPSSLHSTVTPYLTQRDKNYQDGINKVHSQYEQYKPFLENEVPQDRIAYALQVAQAIEERPQDMVKALTEYLQSQGMSAADAKEVAKETVASEPGQVESEIPEELLQHPMFQEMQKKLDTVAQYLVSEKQAEEQRQQDAQLDADLKALRDKHGDFDEEMVLTWAVNNPNKTLDEAVLAYRDKVNQILEANRRNPAPKVLSSGGDNISNEITSDDLKDPKSRKSVVQQMLQRAAQS